jgi:hypothetical protein
MTYEYPAWCAQEVLGPFFMLQVMFMLFSITIDLYPTKVCCESVIELTGS